MMLPWPYMMTAWWFGTTRVEAWEDSLPTTHYPLSTIHYTRRLCRPVSLFYHGFRRAACGRASLNLGGKARCASEPMPRWPADLLALKKLRAKG